MRPNPFPIAVLVLLMRGMEIHPVQPADREREDDLDEAVRAVGDVPEGHLAAADEAHGDGGASGWRCEEAGDGSCGRTGLGDVVVAIVATQGIGGLDARLWIIIITGLL